MIAGQLAQIVTVWCVRAQNCSAPGCKNGVVQRLRGSGFCALHASTTGSGRVSVGESGLCLVEGCMHMGTSKYKGYCMLHNRRALEPSGELTPCPDKAQCVSSRSCVVSRAAELISRLQANPRCPFWPPRSP